MKKANAGSPKQTRSSHYFLKAGKRTQSIHVSFHSSDKKLWNKGEKLKFKLASRSEKQWLVLQNIIHFTMFKGSAVMWDSWQIRAFLVNRANAELIYLTGIMFLHGHTGIANKT